MNNSKAKTAAASTANLRHSVGPFRTEPSSNDDSTDNNTRLTRTQSQHGAVGNESDSQVPFPQLHAEDEAPTSWLIPRVRSMLHDSETLMNSTRLGRKNKGKGAHVWYSSYTTIDWLHDDIREQARLRALRAVGGTKGWWLNHLWDPIQGWLLVVLVGILCGLFAGFISEWSELLAGWKTGYCRADWRLSKTTCCRESAIDCEYWYTWEPRTLSRVMIFVCFGTIYTLIAAVMVVKSATRVTVANHGVSSSVETKVSPTVKLAYYGAGSGIPEVKSILAGFVIHGFLGVRILLVKTFGLILCCASGIITGKEGPMVQIASSLGNISTRIFDKYYKNEAKKREIISAASAAGVSVAFGAPIGGVLFSLEEVSYFFPNKTMLRSLACALVAALVLKAYNPFGTGKLVLFQTTYDMDYHWFEMIPFVIIGVFGGLYGALFCRINMAVNRLRKNTRLGHYPITEVIAITSLTLYCSFGNPFTRIGLGELVGSLFQECPVRDPHGPYNSDSDDIEELLCVSGNQLSEYMPLLSMLAFALVNRAFFAATTFGAKIPSGLVLPSMSTGAIFGRIVGSYMEYLTRANAGHSIFAQCPADSRCVIPGIYALVGAGATLTGTTHTTIAVVAILMELTGNLIYTLPVLVGVMTARWVSEYFNPNGIYDMLIEHAGHPFFDTKTQYIHTRRTAAELMQTDLETICVDFENENTLSLLSARLTRIAERGLSDGGFPVINSRGYLQGWIACTELEFALSRCHSLKPTTVCFFNNPLWQMDYLAHDPNSIPHFRMPLSYVKARDRQKKNSLVSEDSTSDPQGHIAMLSGFGKRWKSLFASQEAGNSDNYSSVEPPLLAPVTADADSAGNVLPSYQSNGHTVRSDSSSHSGESSNSGSSNTQSNKALQQTTHNTVPIPYFQDRPNDFTPFVDQTPLAISPNAPIELVATLLGRLGVSCLCVVDKGIYCGVIFKKAYIGYAKELEEAGYIH
ncbi:hypothetical protein IW140_000469 [Coemansia sp. RSA 1813]|nr:hypothetical protein EV178_000572 [Coemansia sp. RSA 1646]KAJ1771238.1 hypothetical protein LPJ74_002506 [Coemansia sp. RSA 1843]KAJ2092808.1 hypothetical protein IW138_000903 [Coemansia sp. RSA 986]KAJ2217692.1 hypothetical protein EV179_000177 [Coemansia sp. RSA 487]KAJ2573070.1 hypothetical protein IW140_000469 [Coemansia sp. RSA 1813]